MPQQEYAQRITEPGGRCPEKPLFQGWMVMCKAYSSDYSWTGRMQEEGQSNRSRKEFHGLGNRKQLPAAASHVDEGTRKWGAQR